ncbi:MAG: cation diffusion facilitator family transporter [Bacillota bacterium]|nr:cation diffusion facilitator family transporter [Bacillota bacterium]
MEIREQVSKKVLLISVWSNVLLAVGKCIFGYFGHSNAVFADGIHSGTDVFTSIIALFIIKISNKPADEDHPYGHGKAEIMSSGIVGVLLIIISLYLGYEGIIGLIQPLETPKAVTLYVALFSFVFKQFLFRYSLKIAIKYNSKAVEAIAIDHKADIAASFTAAIGVILFQVGLHRHIEMLLYSDKVASIIVAGLIFKMAIEIIVETIDILLERNIDGEILENLSKIISQFEEVKRIDKIRAREYGHYIIVDVRIAIDHNRTIKEGHDLAKEIKFTLIEKYTNIEEVLIHFNPYYQES